MRLKRTAGGYVHCLPNGAWVETDGPELIHMRELPDGPEIRELVGYSSGYVCNGFLERVAILKGKATQSATRRVAYPGRRGFGADSYQVGKFTEDTELLVGGRYETVKASADFPVGYISTVEVVCGRVNTIIVDVAGGRRGVMRVVPSGFEEATP